MNSHQLISKFVAQICEKQFAYAHNTLATIIEAKMKEKIKKIAAKASKKDVKKGAKKDDKKKSTKMDSKKNK